MIPYYLDSKSSILGLSNQVSFVSKFFRDGGQNSQNVFLKSFGIEVKMVNGKIQQIIEHKQM